MVLPSRDVTNHFRCGFIDAKTLACNLMRSFSSTDATCNPSGGLSALGTKSLYAIPIRADPSRFQAGKAWGNVLYCLEYGSIQARVRPSDSPLPGSKNQLPRMHCSPGCSASWIHSKDASRGTFRDPHFDAVQQRNRHEGNGAAGRADLIFRLNALLGHYRKPSRLLQAVN